MKKIGIIFTCLLTNVGNSFAENSSQILPLKYYQYEQIVLFNRHSSADCSCALENNIHIAFPDCVRFGHKLRDYTNAFVTVGFQSPNGCPFSYFMGWGSNPLLGFSLGLVTKLGLNPPFGCEALNAEMLFTNSFVSLHSTENTGGVTLKVGVDI